MHRYIEIYIERDIYNKLRNAGTRIPEDDGTCIIIFDNLQPCECEGHAPHPSSFFF